MPESPDSSLVSFGPFTLDPAARKLWRGTERLALPSRAVDALAYLVAHRDRIVEKDEIIAAVWHDVAVTDDSLIHAVSVIRRALGDDPTQAAFVETIPRRGYRFVARVEVLEEVPQPRADTKAPRSWTPAIVAGCLTLCAFAAGGF